MGPVAETENVTDQSASTMAGSRRLWMWLEEEQVLQWIPRPRFCLRLLRGPLPPSTNVTNVLDDGGTGSQTVRRYKGNR